jgi:hypothetical protein
MTEEEIIALINLHIVANGNNEITANVLRPILIDILGQPNDKIGELTDLNTTDKTSIVNAVNELTNTLNSGFNIHEGTLDPNITPPASFSIGDWYIRSGISLYQYNGDIWVLLSSVPIVLPAPQDLQSVLDTGDYAESSNLYSSAEINLDDNNPLVSFYMGSASSISYSELTLSNSGFLLEGSGGGTSPTYSLDTESYNKLLPDDTGQLSFRLGNVTAKNINIHLNTPSNAIDDTTYTIPLSVNGVFADVDGNIPVTGANSSIGTGTVIDLSNPLVTYYNMVSASSSLVYTLGTIVNGGKARLLVNAPSLPAITGAINIKGDAFQANTDIYLEVENSNGRIEYWVKQIFVNPTVDLTALPFGNIIATSTNYSTIYTGSPSLIKTSTNRLLVSHDYYGAGSGGNTSAIYKSDNNGQTWTFVQDIVNVVWGMLFEYSGDLYLIGISNFVNGSINISKSVNNGDTWSTPVVIVPTALNGYHTTSTSFVIKDGFFVKSVERLNGTTWASSFQEALLFGNLTDLMNPASWSLSNIVSFNSASYPLTIGNTADAINRPGSGSVAKGFLEGNVIEKPDGSLIILLRLEQSPNSNNAVYLNVTWNAANPTASTIISTHNYIEMQGGNVKFNVINDYATSGKYYTISNVNKYKYFPDFRAEAHLISSADLINWTVNGKALGYEPSINWESEIAQLGFQYSTSIIDGNDLLIATRTSNESGNTYHNANLITFTKFENFRTSPQESYINGSLIIDENSQRLEDANGISVIKDQSKYYNSPYLLNANNTNKPNWVIDGIQFDGVSYLKVPHNKHLNLNNSTGASIFIVVENLQGSTAGRFMAKAALGSGGLGANEYTVCPEAMTVGTAWTTGLTDLTLGNDYIFAYSFDNVGNDIYQYLNGVNRGNPPSKTNCTWVTDHLHLNTPLASGNIHELFIGRRNFDTSPLYLTCKIKALHIIPSYMTPTEMIAYQTALNAIYSIY